jgi:glycosyltransferase involved in cell wall biosynthesis
MPDFYNPIYYSIIKKKFLRHGFSGIEDVQINFSQLHQDLFVLCALNGKRQGFYLEIGAHEPIFISNTYLLEHVFGWSGVSLELDEGMCKRHAEMRTSPCLNLDALKVDYLHLLGRYDAPEVIDYLSLDIDPPQNSLRALKMLPHDKFRFRVITFEHDFSFGGARERLESREFLSSLGYVLAVADVSWDDHIVEDWWLDPKNLEMEVISGLMSDNSRNNLHDRYFYDFPSTRHVAPAIQPDLPDISCQRVDLAVNGWIGINHSYALVNQWQLREFLRYPLEIRHNQQPFYVSNWNNKENASGLPSDVHSSLSTIKSLGPNEKVECSYGITYPIDLSDTGADSQFVFATTEFGDIPPEQFFKGDTVDECMRRNSFSLVTPSEWSKRGLVRYGFDQERIFVIPHGFSAELFKPIEPGLRRALRKALGLSEGEFVLLNVSCMTGNKGIDLLLRAYASLRSKYPFLRLVLKDQSNLYGITFSQLLETFRSANLDLDFNDELLGSIVPMSKNLPLDQLSALYGVADLYVSPYRAEGFNLPVLEAAACGTPVIVTKGGSTDDFFSPSMGLQVEGLFKESVWKEGPRKGMTKVSIEPDFGSLVAAIESMVQRRDSLAFNPREAALPFEWKRIGKQLKDLMLP